MTDSETLKNANHHERLYAVARQIPAGRVATYGQLAAVAGRGCTARIAGYAMAAIKVEDRETPWHRVINAKGEISPRDGSGPIVQRAMLEKEGIVFDDQERVDFNECGWEGPPWSWLEEHHFYPAPLLKGKKKKPPAAEQPSLF